MKVICINNKPLDGGRWPLLESLIVGNEYTVAEIKHNGKGYVLEETYKEQKIERQAFLSSRFAPTSDIDETTFERNYNTQTV